MNPIKSVYDSFVRPRVPRRRCARAGYSVVANRRILDVTGSSDPHYEYQARELLDRALEDGDSVVIAGAGYGITSMWAAERIGSGTVHAYEARSTKTRLAEQNLELNDIDNVTITNAIVGEIGNGTYHDTPDGDRIPPSALPACDVMELDIEGSEGAVLSALEHWPRDLIIEVHPSLGTSRGDIDATLPDGYRIVETMDHPGSDTVSVWVTRRDSSTPSSPQSIGAPE